MTGRVRWPLALVCLVGLTFVSAGTGFAQSTDGSAGPADGNEKATSAQASLATKDDDATLQPAEPDFRLVNLPTTLRLPLYKSNFELTHRFGGNLRNGDFGQQASNLFGLDQGAIVGFEYRFAVARHVQAAIYRTALDKTFQFYGKYDALHQTGSRPVSVSALVSVEGADNFQERYAPALGIVVSRMINQAAAVYAAPIWVHNTAGLGADRDTFFVGVGGRVRIRPTVYLVGEVSPRVSGYAPGPPEFGFGIEKRAGGHLFQLNFTNTFATTFGQTARGGFPKTLHLGLNLSRKFF